MDNLMNFVTEFAYDTIPITIAMLCLIFSYLVGLYLSKLTGANKSSLKDYLNNKNKE